MKRHNKYKNTGILFELLTRQITSDIIANKESKAIDIIKEYFNKTELAKENKIYQTLINSKVLNETKAELLINTALDVSLRLNKTTLRREKYNVIKEIKKHYNLEEFFKIKIPNYPQYAAVNNLIETHNSTTFTNPAEIISNKITLLEHITRNDIDKDQTKDRILEEYLNMDKGVRMLVYKKLLEKFNDKYSDLLPVQKTILKEYINNNSNNIKLQELVNNNYLKIRILLEKYIPKVTDKTVKIKLKEVVNLLKPIDKNQKIKDENIVSLLQYYQLIEELKIVDK